MSVRNSHPTAPINASVETVREHLERRLEYLSEELEPEEIPPSETAKRTCTRLLTAAAARMPGGSTFPFPHISTSGEGDLSCEWAGEAYVIIALISPGGVAALHEMDLQTGRVVSQRTTADAGADELRAALEKWLSASPES